MSPGISGSWFSWCGFCWLKVDRNLCLLLVSSLEIVFRPHDDLAIDLQGYGYSHAFSVHRNSPASSWREMTSASPTFQDLLCRCGADMYPLFVDMDNEFAIVFFPTAILAYYAFLIDYALKLFLTSFLHVFGPSFVL